MASLNPPRLIDQTRRYLRVHRYALHTERTYIQWIKRYIRYHRMKTRRHLLPAEPNIEASLSRLPILSGHI